MELPRPVEAKAASDDPFLDMLPFLLSDAVPEQSEHTFAELDANSQERYLELMKQRERLAEQGRLPTGTDVVLFVSELGYEPVTVQVLTTNHYMMSETETAEHMAAAESIAHRVKSITSGAVRTNIQIASREAMDVAVLDNQVAHIIFIGHANSSALALGPEEDYRWDDPPKELDHLKLSFGVFGCGFQTVEAPRPRVGSALTLPDGILYGVGKQYFDEGTPYDFAQLVRLPNGVLEGTPSDG